MTHAGVLMCRMLEQCQRYQEFRDRKRPAKKGEDQADHTGGALRVEEIPEGMIPLLAEIVGHIKQ